MPISYPLLCLAPCGFFISLLFARSWLYAHEKVNGLRTNFLKSSLFLASLTNRPQSIYQYSNMAPRLSWQTSIFGAVFFVSKSLLEIERQKKIFKHLQFGTGSLRSMLEYWYIERGLFQISDVSRNFSESVLNLSYRILVSVLNSGKQSSRQKKQWQSIKINIKL